ncbi:MAG: ABC transporter permease subunit [Nevskiales bacterium]|nr:ABC transporter permease subunit [Nevskiales bacterium]
MSPAAETAVASPAGAYAEPRVHLRWRYLKDLLARNLVGIGGVAVLAALLLIFVYLLTEVFPLFRPAVVEPRAQFRLPGDGQETLYLTAEEQAEIGLRVSAGGEVMFFDLGDGTVRKQLRLPVGERRVVQIAPISMDQNTLAAGLSDGSVLVFKHAYTVTYPDDRRRIDPGLEFPYGETPLPFMDEAPRSLTVRDERGQLFFAATDRRNRVRIKALEAQTGLLGGSQLQVAADLSFTPELKAQQVLVNPLMDWLSVIDMEQGKIAFYHLRGAEPPELLNTVEAGAPVQQATYMAGGISILVTDQTGKITQWFPARRPESAADGDAIWYLARVRGFEGPGGAVTALAVEQRRRGFAVGTESGRVALYYSTSQRKVLELDAFDEPVSVLAFEPRAHALLALSRSGSFRSFRVENEHPEVSWSALWGKIWYESYDEPRQLWQSSAASSDFEPKFSLAPLTLGTLKGAFYAMLFAIPLAVLGAIFTANFMAPTMRQVVKPTVEIMQALPTVVLGFLAGLWLAPFVEAHLPGVFLTLLLLPFSIPLVGYGWQRLPDAVRFRVPAGWEAALLIPVVVGVVWCCFVLAKPMEEWLFGGNMQAWMDRELGIGYDQRNSLVVGIAMGVAVIPSIFSIAEDAIFSVPKQLTLGSMALGATPWQTLMGVVLPTASPGIFAAVMIGMGRAVGETMIVLMATGNTPVMDFSLFSGMRTLSANVAVEMPESEVGSTHFRLLFLAGLVLFLFTFAINTVAEVVRQRLREKYGHV